MNLRLNICVSPFLIPFSHVFSCSFARHSNYCFIGVVAVGGEIGDNAI